MEEKAFAQVSFEKLGRGLNLKMVPNEDGLGPSTALFYVAQGLAGVAEKHGISLKFIVQNESSIDFNISVYERLKSTGVNVVPKKQDSVIRLIKDGERVVPMDTAELLLDYLWKSKHYISCESLDLASEGIDAVICMGTPVAHPAAKELKIPVIEIFDHSWPLSIKRIIKADEKEHSDEWRTRKINQVVGSEERFKKSHWEQKWDGKTVYDVTTKLIIPAIESHDRMVDHVFMFPEPLAPTDFFCKWQSLVPGKVTRIGGVMGGWKDNEIETARTEARKDLAPKLKWETTNLEEAKIVLVQGGGTPTWEKFLIHMVGQCVDWSKYLTNTLFLFPKRMVNRAFISEHSDKATLKQRQWNEFRDLEQAVRVSRTARLIVGNEEEDFANFQKFYLVSDLVFSRPGGITVQDAIACRTPIVCAAEPGHWQTEKIRQQCELNNLLRPVKFEAFEAGGIGLALDQFGLKEANEQMKEAMRAIANQQEYNLAEEILKIIAESKAKK